MKQVTNVQDMYEAFKAAQVEPMNENVSQIFASLCIADAAFGDRPNSLDKFSAAVKEKPTFTYEIMRKRMDYAVPKHDWHVLLLIMLDVLSQGSPGKAVMWAAFAVGLVRNSLPAKLETFTQHFPFGFPTEEALEAIWDSQKNDGANLIDQSSFWK